MELLDDIQTLGIFQGVSAGSLALIAERSRARMFGAGEMLIGEEEHAHAFYVVLSGQIKLYKSSPEGKEQTLFLLGPGQPFGMCTAFVIDSFPANATALEPSRVLLIPGPLMEAVALKEPRLLVNIIASLSERLKESMSLIESLSLKEIPQRLASFVLHDLDRGGEKGAGRLELTVTQRELAKILGATPEALSRAIRKMSNTGLLAVNGRSVRIIDRQALAALAEGEEEK